MLTMVTNPGLHRGSCPNCTAEYRARVEHYLEVAESRSRWSGRSIDFILDEHFDEWHASSHGAFL